MKLNGWIGSAALLLAAACGGGDAGEPAAQSPAGVQAAAAVTEATPAGTSAPAPDAPPVASAPQPAAEPIPSKADSAAAVAEDVSPEWKQRQRSMASYEECMAQTRGAEAAVRPRLEEACSRLRGAP